MKLERKSAAIAVSRSGVERRRPLCFGEEGATVALAHGSTVSVATRIAENQTTAPAAPSVSQGASNSTRLHLAIDAGDVTR